uniref:ATP synthase subunit a n=1 Tax=Goniomonas avonlea TaxID=1255295 RepID=A0A348G6M6_9CRYP|nr:ATP synthase F0 subunit a [Goniomonas avonlea]
MQTFQNSFVVTPLEQFEILPLFKFFSISERFVFTNSSFFVFLVFFVIIGWFYFSILHQSTLFPNYWQNIVESIYLFILDMIQDTIGEDGYSYFPFIFVSFIFVLTCNLLGMIPYTFTVTSHIVITFSLGMATFIGINIVAFRQHGLHFFSFFFPKDAPLMLTPFLVLIELLSYVFRVLSLSIRLFANMMAGHTLLKILAGFAWTMLSAGGIFYILQFFPLAVVLALTGLEMGIAILQAYVWTVLVCIYLNDAIHLH